jgi:hypothetical protein
MHAGIGGEIAYAQSAAALVVHAVQHARQPWRRAGSSRSQSGSRGDRQDLQREALNR